MTAFLLFLACRAVPAPPAYEGRIGIEVTPRFLKLPPWLELRESMISGLAWYGNQLFLLPQQRPVRGETSVHRGKLYSISLAALLREVSQPTGVPLPVETWTLHAPGIDTLPGFEGFEAIVFAGDSVFATVEANTDQPHAWLLRGRVDAGARTIQFASPATRIPGQSGLPNLTEEALVLHHGVIVSLHEANGQGVNPGAVAHLYPVTLGPGASWTEGTVAMTPLDYRVTDATAADETGRFWVTNYLWEGDSALRIDEHSVEDPPPGSGSAGVDWMERLVELRITPAGITTTGRPPVYLEPGEESRNWEGVVKLGSLGFLIVVDKFPETLLAFVPFPMGNDPNRQDASARP